MNKEIGGQTEGFICKLCGKLCEESESRPSKSGLICENCDEEPNLGETSEKVSLVEQNQAVTNSFSTFANKQEKAVEINNVEDLNNQIQIPPELNIIDCPSDVNSDPEWFRKQFRNFWRLFNDDSEWTFVIHDRGSCKSKNDAIIILYNIVMFPKFEGSFVMRNWEEPFRQSKEYFKKLIREFDEVIWKGQRTTKDKSQWGLLWLSTYKGVSYKKNIQDKASELRCHFFSLFSSDNARTLINEPIKIVIFDECVPTRKQILKGKGWDLKEPSDYMELMKSLGRGTKPKKIFTGNPNDSFYNCWFLVQHFKEELKELSKWYWKNRPSSLDKWLSWSWTKELKKGNKTLQLQKIATKKEDFDNYEEGNWDNFFPSSKKSKIVEHKNSATPLWVFNNCVFYISKQKYFYFIWYESKEISNRDRELISKLPEYCTTTEQRMRSNQRIKRDREKWEFQRKLLRWYEKNRLFFADAIAESLIEEFLAKKRTPSEF